MQIPIDFLTAELADWQQVLDEGNAHKDNAARAGYMHTPRAALEKISQATPPVEQITKAIQILRDAMKAERASDESIYRRPTGIHD